MSRRMHSSTRERELVDETTQQINPASNKNSFFSAKNNTAGEPCVVGARAICFLFSPCALSLSTTPSLSPSLFNKRTLTCVPCSKSDVLSALSPKNRSGWCSLWEEDGAPRCDSARWGTTRPENRLDHVRVRMQRGSHRPEIESQFELMTIHSPTAERKARRIRRVALDEIRVRHGGRRSASGPARVCLSCAFVFSRFFASKYHVCIGYVS